MVERFGGIKFRLKPRSPGIAISDLGLGDFLPVLVAEIRKLKRSDPAGGRSIHLGFMLCSVK
jgi:hypothetical protein